MDTFTEIGIFDEVFSGEVTITVEIVFRPVVSDTWPRKLKTQFWHEKCDGCYSSDHSLQLLQRIIIINRLVSNVRFSYIFPDFRFYGV